MRLREQVAGLTLSKVPVGVPIFVAVVGAVFSKLDHYLAGSFLAAGMLVLAIWCRNPMREEHQLAFKCALVTSAISCVIFGLGAAHNNYALVPAFATIALAICCFKSENTVMGWIGVITICSFPKP
jgi:hypothetical protein